MHLRILGTGSLSDFLGDAVAYRSLAPLDSRLPGLEDLRSRPSLAGSRIPRKVEPEYARVVVEILRVAGRVLVDTEVFDAAVMLGDTEHNDGGAFLNVCEVLGCPGGAFICDEAAGEPNLTRTDHGAGRSITLANRWRLIADFEAALAREGIRIGRGTAVLVDIDKTALGARGRNHSPIDDARAAAVVRTAEAIRGEGMNRPGLMAAYHLFNQPRFHAFTTDNQDYIAYLAMIAEAGWAPADEIEKDVASGRFKTVMELMSAVTATSDGLPREVRKMHRRVVDAVEAGDPTPFKDFRRSEFRETVARMTPVDTDDLGDVLRSRLTLTHEVWRAALDWRDRGALIFGLSDKPDEASCPAPEEIGETGGPGPLHRTKALVVGDDELTTD